MQTINDTIEISKENAIKAFDNATAKGKKLLSDLIGEENLVKNITERVKTFEDACKVLGIQTVDVLPAANGLEKDIKSITAYRKLCVVSRALNEGWEPDWNNSNQPKYYPYHRCSGSRFSYVDSYFVCASSVVGSRLCYRTAELAKYAGKQFEDLYNEFLTM